MVAKSFEVGDLVWAKMKGYSPWPGKIMVPPADAKPKKNNHYVFFFGSENHAWILDENIQLHSEVLVEKYGNKKTGLYQSAVETIIERSKGISKYHRSTKEGSETPDGESVSNTTIKMENSFDKSANSEVKSRTKSFSSNGSSSTTKKFKKKLPIKKMSSVKKISLVKKPARKRTHSSDQSDLDSFTSSYGISEIFNRSAEPYSPKSLRFDESYAQLMSNIPPNLSYNTDGICSSLAPVTGVLQRKYHDRPDTPPIDLMYQSDVLKKKKIEPTNKKIGFLGLGKISQGIVKNLYHSGHSIIIWNQTPNECMDFAEKFKITIAATPADVIDAADITFSCLSDADNAKQIVFGNCGILKQLEHRNGERKGYVEMTSMDPKCSEAIGHEIRMKGGRYLEAPLSGSRIDANESTLLVLAAGDESLYEECKSCFDAISKRHLFVGTEVGTGSKLALVHNMFVGTLYASVAEALALVKRFGLKGENFLDILKDGVISSQSICEKGMAMIKNEYVSNTSLRQTQLDLNLGLSLGDKLAQPTPIFAIANEVYKHCKSMRYGDHDVSAVFEGTKP